MSISQSRWQRWVQQWVEDLKCVFYLSAILSGFRLLLLCLFHSCSEMPLTTSGVFAALVRGGRFDIRVACYLMALPILLSPLLIFKDSHHRFWLGFRRFWMYLWILLTVFTCTLNTLFFAEFKKQFNYRIYGLFFDDRTAIFGTAWQTYPLIKILLGALCLIGVLWKGFSLWQKPLLTVHEPKKPLVLLKKLSIVTLFTALLVTGLRGTLCGQLLKEREVQTTNNLFLADITLNPYISLFYTHLNYQVTLSAAGIQRFWPNASILDAIKQLYPKKQIQSTLISDWLTVKTQTEGHLFEKTRHVFIIIMESQEGWPLLPPYHALQFYPNLLEITQKGRWIKAIASSTGTMHAITAITTGLPEVFVYPNHQPSSEKPYPTAIAPIAKRLGFNTHFFYGGSVSWENIGIFEKNQGFDSIDTCVELDKPGNYWGVDDEYLFDYILDTIRPNEKTFSVVMTTSNHPPHTVDVETKGFGVKKIPAQYGYDGSTPLHLFGHYRYCDQALGDFIRKAEKRYPDALFVITADHPSGHFLNSAPPALERYLIPLVFYSPNNPLPEVPAQAVGSHNDILPTVINLIAPKQFAYPTFGRDLFDPKTDYFGIHSNLFMTPQGLYYENGNLLHAFHIDAPSTQPNAAKTLKATQAVSWHLVMKGNTIDSKP